MKLRIKGNSLRLRLTRSELDRLVNDGRIEETLWLGADPHSRLVYALEQDAHVEKVMVRYSSNELAVILSSEEVLQWKTAEQIGIYAAISLGPRGTLEVAVEKDFACLSRSGDDNADAFPNPHAKAAC